MAVHPIPFAKTTRRDIDAGGWFIAVTQSGSWGDLPPILAAYAATVLSGVMQAYARHVLRVGVLAQRHNAEALFVGSGTNLDNRPGSGLWSQPDQWTAMVSELRRIYPGSVGIGRPETGAGSGEPGNLETRGCDRLNLRRWALGSCAPVHTSPRSE